MFLLTEELFFDRMNRQYSPPLIPVDEVSAQKSYVLATHIKVSTPLHDAETPKK
jgi:hypothetical protein